MISFLASGAIDSGVSSLSLAIPSGVASGDMLLMAICSKYPPTAPATPTGWTLDGSAQFSGGAGSSGVDSGQVTATIFWRVATGAEGASISVTVPSGNVATGRIIAYRADSGSTWTLGFAYGSDGTTGTDWSVQFTPDPGIVENDVIVTASAVNGNVGLFHSHSFTASGCTFGARTERMDNGTTVGDDALMFIVEAPCTIGPSGGVLTHAATAAASSGNFPAGAAIMVRLREVPAAPSTPAASDERCDHDSGLLGTGLMVSVPSSILSDLATVVRRKQVVDSQRVDGIEEFTLAREIPCRVSHMRSPRRNTMLGAQQATVFDAFLGREPSIERGDLLVINGVRYAVETVSRIPSSHRFEFQRAKVTLELMDTRS